MSGTEKLKQIIAKHLPILEEMNKRRDWVDSQKDKPAEAGDMYVFKIPENVGLSWLVIGTHPDDEDLFRVVPVDTWSSMCGIYDVVCNDSREPIIARCGHCVWLSREFVELNSRCEIGKTEFAKSCREILAKMVRDEVKPTKEQLSVNDDPEYDHYLGLIANACNNLS